MKQTAPVENIRLYTEDARLLLEKLPDASIDQAYILFPDPWPKPKQHKRRIVSIPTLDELARIQPVGARLQLATDHEEYGVWMLEKLLAHPAYEWLARCKADWQTPPEDWVVTRYQQKTTKAGRKPLFLQFRRRATEKA